jgi:hypothetical protein
MEPIRAGSALALVVAALGAGACGGGGTSLEEALARGSKAICDGDCKSFHATHAACAAKWTAVGSARFYRCDVYYDNGGPTDHVCAALAGSKAVLKPLSTCRR